jgi:HEAT repeat protein
VISFYCPACWTEIERDAAVCPACGADVASLDRSEFDDELIRALGHSEAQTVRRVTEILGRRRTRQAVPALLARDRAVADPYLGAEIALALGRIGGAEARAALSELESDPSVVVQRAVADALRGFGDIGPG